MREISSVRLVGTGQPARGTKRTHLRRKGTEEKLLNCRAFPPSLFFRAVLAGYYFCAEFRLPSFL